MEQQGEIPRAARFPADGELLYIEVARLAWHAGSLVNVGSSGLLFEGTHPIQAGTAIEMTLLGNTDAGNLNFDLSIYHSGCPDESSATRQSRFIAWAWWCVMLQVLDQEKSRSRTWQHA